MEAKIFYPKGECSLQIDYTQEEEEKNLKTIHKLKNIEKISLKWKISAEIIGNLGEIMQIIENFPKDFAINHCISFKNVEILSLSFKENALVDTQHIQIKCQKEKHNNGIYLKANEVSSQIAISQILSLNTLYELSYELDLQQYLNQYLQTLQEVLDKVCIIGEIKLKNIHLFYQEGYVNAAFLFDKTLSPLAKHIL